MPTKGCMYEYVFIVLGVRRFCIAKCSTKDRGVATAHTYIIYTTSKVSVCSAGIAMPLNAICTAIATMVAKV